MKFIKLTFVSFIIICTIFSVTYYINATNYVVLRLHVKANSNSNYDQNIKKIVAKEVDNYIYNLTKDKNNLNDIYEIIINNKDNITKFTDDILKKNNITYNSNIFIGNIYFDEKKENEDISFNEGFYNCIIITLGEGKGNNFFNILLPKKEDIENLKNLENAFPILSNLSKNNFVSKENTNKEEQKDNIIENFLIFLNKNFLSANNISEENTGGVS